MATKQQYKGQFPRPQFKQVEDGAKRNAIKFFNYWKGLKPLLAAIVEVRVYRLWPACDLFLADPARKGVDIQLIEGPIPFEPEEYEEFFFRAHGCGRYRCTLTEKGEANEVMRAYFGEQSIDPENPPKVDPITVLNSPTNKYYIDWLRANEKPLPRWATREMGPGNEDSEMSNGIGEALRVATDATVRMANHSVEMAQSVAEARVRAIEDRNHEPDARDVAVRESIGMVTQTANEMVKMVTQNSGKQYDPIDMMRTTAELFSKSQTGPDITGILTLYQQSNDRVFSLFSQQAEMYQRMLTRDSTAVVHQPAQKSMLEELETVSRMAELMGFSRGGVSRARHDDAPTPAAAPGWFNENTAPMVMLGAQAIFTIIGNAIYNWSCVKIAAVNPNADMKPEAPNDAIRKAAATNPMLAHLTQQQPGAGGAAVDPQKDAKRRAAEEAKAQWNQFLKDFEAPLLQYFFQGGSGTDLAYYLISDGKLAGPTKVGIQNYVALKRLGPRGLDMMLRGFTSIWSALEDAAKADEPRYLKFLEDFMSLDDRTMHEGPRMGSPAVAAQ